MSPSPPALSPIHDFARKLRQVSFLPRVLDYVAWRRAVLEARERGETPPALPAWAPFSINLDLTTACNFACPHCVDWDILNSGRSYDDRHLRTSLAEMRDRGLKSVILIGGGEPTVYPRFVDMVRTLKSLELQVAIVSNGSRNERILEAVDVLDDKDWIRLSLDAGSDATFQAMHQPKKAVTLESICSWIPRLRDRNPRPRVGFSFVITWEGAERRPDAPVVENLHEMVAAARLARASRFDYVSFKPFLVRTPEGAEVIDPDASGRRHAEVVARIRASMDEAKQLATSRFAVFESTNLKLLESGQWREWTRQPRTCHMQVFRQVLSPLGLWNCPAHRGVEAGRITDADAFLDEERVADTSRALGDLLDSFDASKACREVTCLYNDVNWWLERRIRGDMPADALEPEVDEDFFL